MYAQIGKVIFCTLSFVLGSTSAISAQPIFTIPVNLASRYTASGTYSLGTLYIEDLGNVGYYGDIITNSATQASMQMLNVSGTYAQKTGFTSTTPFTWGTGDFLKGTFVYEAA